MFEGVAMGARLIKLESGREVDPARVKIPASRPPRASLTPFRVQEIGISPEAAPGFLAEGAR
jgi:hypothetical protein